MNLLMVYEEAVKRGDIDKNPAQVLIIEHMQRVAADLENSQKSWIPWRRSASVKGLYLYGPVGVGKTYLVDLFYENVSEPKKGRFHFHHFMQQIDAQLRKFQGQKDPLRQIAKEISNSIRLLCFDEFLVHDVAYAMILAELLQALHLHGVTLVISSNTHPDDLYKNGVHRKRFLPAIKLIKKECEVLNLHLNKDYRLGREPLLETYLYPLNESTQATLDRQYKHLAKGDEFNGAITVQNREIPYLRCHSNVIWFDFNLICNSPRSQLDYLEIAERFDAVFVSGIPKLTENHTVQAIMFIHFIDVMYDRGIKVVLSAEVSVQELYLKGEMKETFKRTLSRLLEMQSVDYLARHPKRSVKAIVS
ncbi:cell division protein ZapE [Legionella waltersii]|uniref:ATPase N2B (Nucleotide (GTP) binding protein) n=1 Tax=Legionella waltersii TaxID=66969 RepID=A0A0W1AD11_9GAMM|nr:cell division protein ZapE [Legionella waltersii]KTD79260.1 ATPase N2B (nucleotide (GTP) binding protein) [Legionella waltersii]SNV12762.1 ATPase N2B (nucleotide (GTP) binding protein) [Legionella waltersii]